MNEREHLSTADLAKTSDDMRGHRQESAAGRDAVQETPRQPAPVAKPQATRADPRVDAVARGDRSTGMAPKVSLFAERDAADLRKRWSDVQTGFVDEPRKSVEQADSLVAEVMKRLAEGFASERANLEHQWDRGDNVTTEDLRVALQRYRTFFDRLLSV
jgi:hypothetical protein